MRSFCVFPGISGVHDAQHCLCILSGHSRNGLLMAPLWQTKTERRAAAAPETYRNYHSAWHGVYVHFTGGLEENTVEIVKNASDTVKKQKHFALKRSVQQEQIEKIIAEPYREEYLRLADMTTVAERLKGHHLFGSYVSDCRQKMDPYADHTAAKRRGRQRNSRISCHPRRYRGKAAGAKAGRCPARCTGGSGTRQ